MEAGPKQQLLPAEESKEEEAQFSLDLIEYSKLHVAFLRMVHSTGLSLARPSQEAFRRYAELWLPLVFAHPDGPGRPGRFSALSVFLCKSILCGVFVWARRALNTIKRRFPARAEKLIPPARRGRGRRCHGASPHSTLYREPPGWMPALDGGRSDGPARVHRRTSPGSGTATASRPSATPGAPSPASRGERAPLLSRGEAHVKQGGLRPTDLPCAGGQARQGALRPRGRAGGGGAVRDAARGERRRRRRPRGRARRGGPGPAGRGHAGDLGRGRRRRPSSTATGHSLDRHRRRGVAAQRGAVATR